MMRTPEGYLTLDPGEPDTTAESMQQIAAGVGGVTLRLMQMHAIGALGVTDPTALEELMMTIDAADRIKPADRFSRQ